MRRRIGRTAVKLPSSLPQKHPRGLQLDLHIRQPELQRLKIRNRLPERLALFHIGNRLIEPGLRRAQRTGRDIEAPAIQTRHSVREPAAFLAQQMAGGHAAIIELHLPGRLGTPAHLVL